MGAAKAEAQPLDSAEGPGRRPRGEGCDPSPWEKFFRALSKKIDSDDLRGISHSGDRLAVRFDIDYNLTEAMTIDGAQIDTVNILRAVHESGSDVRRVVVAGWFPLVDDIGYVSTEKAFQVTYPRRVIERIDYESGAFEPPTCGTSRRPPSSTLSSSSGDDL